MQAAVARSSPALDASEAAPDTPTALNVLSASFPASRGNKRRWGGQVKAGVASSCCFSCLLHMLWHASVRTFNADVLRRGR
jgi:hypothetical protein